MHEKKEKVSELILFPNGLEKKFDFHMSFYAKSYGFFYKYNNNIWTGYHHRLWNTIATHYNIYLLSTAESLWAQ